MTIKRFTIITVVLAMMAMFASMVVSAHDPDGPRGGRGFGGNSEIITEATGLTRAEIREAVQDGSTVAELIEANGGDVESVVAELVAEATTRINERVEEGRITQEQADEKLAELEANIQSRLDGTYERPEGADGQGRRGRRGGRGFGFGNDTDSTADDTDTVDDA